MKGRSLHAYMTLWNLELSGQSDCTKRYLTRKVRRHRCLWLQALPCQSLSKMKCSALRGKVKIPVRFSMHQNCSKFYRSNWYTKSSRIMIMTDGNPPPVIRSVRSTSHTRLSLPAGAVSATIEESSRTLIPMDGKARAEARHTPLAPETLIVTEAIPCWVSRRRFCVWSPRIRRRRTSRRRIRGEQHDFDDPISTSRR
jgi:hypothetical protein